MDNTVVLSQHSGLAVEGAAPPKAQTFGEGSKTEAVTITGKAEVDTSAPFESVREAVDRFGGSAVWKSQLKQLCPREKLHSTEELELMSVQNQASQLKNDLTIKELETLEVLKELERTKRTLDSLKLRLDEEAYETYRFNRARQDGLKVSPASKHHGDVAIVDSVHAGMHAKHSPGSILVQLEKAKMNLTRSTSNMADVQATIESLKNKIQEEKTLVEKTREKLSSKRTIISRLEDDLKQMKFMLHLTKKANDTCNGDPAAISVEIKNVISQRGHFRLAAEAAKLEILSLGSEIDQIKSGVKTAEIRWLAAKKMEQTAKAAEAVATTQSSVLTNSNSSAPCSANNEAVVLSMEEYAALTHKIEEADESLRGKIEVVMLEVERANQFKLELKEKIEEAEADLKTRKKFLEVALNRVEAANRGKLAVEEALRRWRAENAQKRRCIDNNAKFKNSYPGLHRRDPMMLDLNELNLLNDGACGLKHSLSIGEILSRKLMGPEDYDYDAARTEFSNAKVKVSLGQILNRRPGALSPKHGCEARSQHSSKRKKFGFMGFSQLLKNGRIKQKKSKKKKHTALPR